MFNNDAVYGCISYGQQVSTMRVVRTRLALDTDNPIIQVTAEQVALDLGLLRSCPRCGNRYRVEGKGLSDTNYCSFAAYDPALPLFCGDVDALLTAVNQAVSRHDMACMRCLK